MSEFSRFYQEKNVAEFLSSVEELEKTVANFMQWMQGISKQLVRTKSELKEIDGRRVVVERTDPFESTKDR